MSIQSNVDWKRDKNSESNCGMFAISATKIVRQNSSYAKFMYFGHECGHIMLDLTLTMSI